VLLVPEVAVFWRGDRREDEPAQLMSGHDATMLRRALQLVHSTPASPLSEQEEYAEVAHATADAQLHLTAYTDYLTDCGRRSGAPAFH
jgi:hypothetical protein